MFGVYLESRNNSEISSGRKLGKVSRYIMRMELKIYHVDGNWEIFTGISRGQNWEREKIKEYHVDKNWDPFQVYHVNSTWKTFPGISCEQGRTIWPWWLGHSRSRWNMHDREANTRRRWWSRNQTSSQSEKGKWEVKGWWKTDKYEKTESFWTFWVNPIPAGVVTGGKTNFRWLILFFF